MHLLQATPGSRRWHDGKIPAAAGHASLAGGTRGRACYAEQRSTCSLLVTEFLPESVTKLHRVTQQSCGPGISRKASTLLTVIQRNICTVLTHAPGRGVVPGERPAAACGGGLPTVTKQVQQLDRVIIRFAGDSGDGMQLTGDRFTQETAILGNDISTLPDFPAEIRAPAGSLPGVSGFQLHFADHDILTPGDAPNVLVAMNPAALKTNVADLPKGGSLIVDADAFTERNLQKAGYAQSPLEDGSLDEYQVHAVPLTSLTVGALKEIEGVTPREAERSKNMFAPGLMSWLYGRSIKPSIEFLEAKFGAKRPEIAAANIKALRAGYAFGETTESFAVTYEVEPAKLAPGTYRNITGNQALSLGLVAASRLSGLPLFLGAYPITPASAILEELAGYKHFGVRTFQAEDEIAAAGAAVGAAFGGALGVSTSAGPGIVLKAETVGLALMLELPLVICDIQRAGPSTGMPTKPEQGDLLLVLFGRNSESPVPVVAAMSPSDCFNAASEACRIAVKYRTPVYRLSAPDLANGSEPWLLPDG